MAAKDAEPEVAEEATKPASAKAKSSWLPLILALVLAPAITWSVAQFVLLPQLKASLMEEAADTEIVARRDAPEKKTGPGGGDGQGGSGDHGQEGATDIAQGYKMENVVVNLAGTMGTRYLKASFMVTGSDPDLITKFEGARPQVVDVTLAVLSGLTLADLEEPGSKNIIRERLVDAYNQVFGGHVAEQLYFSEFVIQ